MRSSRSRNLPTNRPNQWRCHLRDNAIEEIKRLDALLEYAVEHGEEAEADGSVSGYSREYIRVSVPEGVPGSVVEIKY